MGIDLLLLQNDKGGDLESVQASQKKRFASEELVTEVLTEYKEWTKGRLALLHLIRRFSDFCGFVDAIRTTSLVRPRSGSQEDQCAAEGDRTQEEGQQ